MNELPTLPDSTTAAGSSADTTTVPPAPPEPSLFQTLMQPQVLACGVLALAVALVAQTWSSHTQVRNLREELARRLQKGEQVNTETNTLARAVQEANKELQAKVALLESKQLEAQSQQLALEQLYQDLSKNRDEWALAEIEQVLSTASQQLQLAGNVPGALIALQNADRSLSRSDKPQFITIRRAIARDTDKLKALPSVDSVGLALRLDNVIAQVDTLPMLADEKPTLPAPPEKKLKPKAVKGGKETPPPAPPHPWVQALQDGWTSWSSEMWTDVRQLVRVRTVDTPDALMLSPGEAYFLRENLKLRLLNARMALLSRNETAFRSDLIAAQEALSKYFDTRARSTQTVQALLRQVQGNNLSIEMPTLADSLNAVRNYKAKP
ncbi:uroporphyrinogen-III C-methyltransferase [Oxalobacteraceae bacterium A2-2]